MSQIALLALVALALTACGQGTPATPTNINSGSGVQQVCTGRGAVNCTTTPPSVISPTVIEPVVVDGATE